MLTKAGEVQAAANMHIGRGFEAQSAVAITNNFGLIANYSHRREGESGNSYFEKRSFLEGGVGYFKNKGRVGFEIFAGYGEGNVAMLNETNMANGTSYSQTGKIHRVFIQPALLDRGSVFSAALVPRFSYVTTSRYQITGDYRHRDQFQQGWYFEPAGAGRVKLHENIFFTFQGGFSIRFSNRGHEHQYVQTGAGLLFRFNAEK